MELYALLYTFRALSKNLYDYKYRVNDLELSIGISIDETVYATTIFLIFWVLVTVVYFYIKKKFFQISFEVNPLEEK